MMSRLFFVVTTLLFAGPAWSGSLALSTQAFTDSSYADVEPPYSYNLVYPVNADILSENPATYTPVFDHRYFMSVFGPRFKQVSTSNVGYFDFHQGADITHGVTFGGITYNDTNNPPDIFSACEGEVDEITDGPDQDLEQTGSGRWVRIRCDDSFAANPAWGNIYLAYRHLASIDPAIDFIGAPVQQGQVVGVMGESGLTTTVHLHFSVRRAVGSGFDNVHPARVFDPTAIPHLLDYLDDAEIEQMTYSTDSARFRLKIPYNQANIRGIRVKLSDESYTRTYDFEYISANAGSDRDNNDYIDGLELYAYPFNRGYTAYRRFAKNLDVIPASYPAGPLHPAIDFRPLLNEGILQTPAYVIDVIARDLPAGYNINDLSIEVVDIWGNGLRAFGDSSQNRDNSVAFVLLDISEDDAEQHQDGTVDVTDNDLEMVNDGSTIGDQLVGLRFRDVRLRQGINIETAFIQFSTDEVDSEQTDLVIAAEDADTSNSFVTASSNISTRYTTSATAAWSPPPWLIVNEVSTDQQTPVLSALVQETTDRYGWTDASALGFVISGTGKRVADSGDNVYYRAPYFYAEYTAGISNYAPSVPTNLKTGAISATSIGLSWSPSVDNISVVGYEIYRNGLLVGTASGTSYTDTGLTADSIYGYQVQAYDANGNRSGLSPAIITQATVKTNNTTKSKNANHKNPGNPKPPGKANGIKQ